ncbi:tRNA (adenine(22)-N(1))-methyltransferase [Paenibacillus sp. GCM10012307]|uniref:SAM-dependent methyltransferase n=1 Tax=Paenibacillus roseus TaxID=2798579 RepID=A0A934J7N0_9BACL|nr:class I SAM-dependent methyltransferase [Paenibacillus roseus]MBJ6363123.1 SAM-dependent methyltransferase [Paenibacillus roseus]
MLNLSNRLERIAYFVGQGRRVADIGSDHALLPVYLLQSGKSPSAIAGELNGGPYEAARRQVAGARLEEAIQVRQGNGLEVVQPGEADTITIAGMGGGLIRDILEAGRLQGKLEGVQELVLQPNVGEELVRRWLFNNGWYLQEEEILEEDGKTYEILHAVREPDADVRNKQLYDPSFWENAYAKVLRSELLYVMGPWLLRKPDANGIWARKWNREIEKLEKISRQMERSELAESQEKLKQLQRDRDELKEVLACLQTDRL